MISARLPGLNALALVAPEGVKRVVAQAAGMEETVRVDQVAASGAIAQVGKGPVVQVGSGPVAQDHLVRANPSNRAHLADQVKEIRPELRGIEFD